MTIALSANTPRVSYTVSQGATQTSFAVPFVFFTASTDLNVFVDGTERTFDASTSNTSLYTVSGGNGSTGTVTTSVTGATGGSTVVITRDIPLARTTDFPSSGAFEISKLNTELDTVTAIQSDFNDSASRAIRLQDFDDAVSMELPLLASRKGTVLGLNATTGAAEAGPTIANVNSLSAITTNINTVAGISANVTTVAGISSNVTTVAGISSNVTTVAGIASNVTTVAGKASLITSDFAADMALIDSTFVSKMNLVTSDFVTDMSLVTADFVSDVNTLATSDIVADLDLLATSDFVSDLNAVEGIKANVTTVAGVASNVTTVAGIASNVTAVAGDASDIGTVASAISNVNTVAGAIANVNTVASANSNISTVAGSISNVNTVASADSNITALNASGVISNIATVAGAVTNVNNVGGSIANVNTVASNLSGVNSFAERYRVASSDPSSNNDEGDLVYNTTDNNLKFFNGSSFVAVGGAISNIVEDTSPQLGGSLDVNGQSIVSVSGGNIAITPDGSGKVIIDGLSHPTSDGSNGQFLKTDGGGNLSFATVTGTTINNNADNRIITGSGSANTLEAEANLTFDGTNLDLGDSKAIRFGASQDLQIYHDSSNSYIKEDGTGSLLIWSTGTEVKFLGGSGAETMLDLNVDGSVDLYHDGSKKLETTSGGVTVTGALTGNVTGNLTGNVTGNVSGSSGSTTGNAATATALQTARTINGVSFNGTANISFATGKIAQVQNVAKSDTFSTNTTSADGVHISGMQVNITPSASSSKVLVTVSLGAVGCSTSASRSSTFQLFRGGTQIAEGDASGSRPRVTFRSWMTSGDTNHALGGLSFTFLDTPNTTGALSYKLHMSGTHDSQTFFLNRSGADGNGGNNYQSRTISTMQAMEVLA